METQNGGTPVKLSVVGCEASGKTVFMSALADYYNGDGRPCLVPENPAANNFQRFQLRQMRSLRQWPPATDPGKTIELDWTLRRDGRTLAAVNLLEFGGETFREAFRGTPGSEGHREAVETLTQHLAASDATVLLVSLKELLRDQGELSAEEFERDTEAVWVTRGLLDFLRGKAPDAKIVIGLTQADRYRGEIAAAGGAAALFRKHWPSIAAVADGIPVVPVASVSATDRKGNPAPGYTTEGVLEVMNEFGRIRGKRKRRSLVPLLSILLVASLGLLFQNNRRPPEPKPAAAGTETATAPVPADRPAPEMRVWHDHRGTPVKARWISTIDDERIILETDDGRRIRALIRKFSEADRRYIEDRLSDPAL